MINRAGRFALAVSPQHRDAAIIVDEPLIVAFFRASPTNANFGGLQFVIGGSDRFGNLGFQLCYVG